MEYTKKNIIGLRVDHRDPNIHYEVVGLQDDGRIITTDLDGTGRSEWHYDGAKVGDVNKWIKEGVWRVREDSKAAKNTENYQIY